MQAVEVAGSHSDELRSAWVRGQDAAQLPAPPAELPFRQALSIELARRLQAADLGRQLAAPLGGGW